MRILLVEDEPLILMDVEIQLQEAGHEVISVSNADSAIGVLVHDTIDVILTDIDMPGSMDGLKLAAAVRLRWPPIKILVTTGKATPTPDQMPVGSAIIPKPYEIQDVLKAVHGFG